MMTIPTPPTCHHEECHKSYRKALKTAKLLQQQQALGESRGDTHHSHQYHVAHRQQHAYAPYSKDRGMSKSYEDVRDHLGNGRRPHLGTRQRSDETAASTSASASISHPPSPISTDSSDFSAGGSSHSSPHASFRPAATNLPHPHPHPHPLSSSHYGSSAGVFPHVTTKSQPSTPFWTPSTSPVLGPLKGLNIDWSSRAGSRATSPTPGNGSGAGTVTFLPLSHNPPQGHPGYSQAQLNQQGHAHNGHGMFVLPLPQQQQQGLSAVRDEEDEFMDVDQPSGLFIPSYYYLDHRCRYVSDS